MKIKFWGTRGSIPVPGKSTLKYGGNTPCISFYEGGEEISILDAGSGIRELGNKIILDGKIKKINIFISHLHWDHVQGLPFFAPLYQKGFKVNFYSNKVNMSKGENIFDVLLQPLYFPVNKDVLNANIKFVGIEENQNFVINGSKISTINNNHSPGTLSYKISFDGKSFVYMTDNEIYYDEKEGVIDKDSIIIKNSNLVKFCNNLDYLVHDTMYNLSDYKNKKGWGHSNNFSLAEFAMLCNIKNVILFHYDPQYTDVIIDNIYKETNDYINKTNSKTNCLASFDNLEIIL